MLLLVMPNAKARANPSPGVCLYSTTTTTTTKCKRTAVVVRAPHTLAVVERVGRVPVGLQLEVILNKLRRVNFS